MERALFGYEEGAFTGASAACEGQWQLAGRGSVVFDAIGDMRPYAQAKLLRAIESREIYRLGGNAAFVNFEKYHIVQRDKGEAGGDGACQGLLSHRPSNVTVARHSDVTVYRMGCSADAQGWVSHPGDTHVAADLHGRDAPMPTALNYSRLSMGQAVDAAGGIDFATPPTWQMMARLRFSALSAYARDRQSAQVEVLMNQDNEPPRAVSELEGRYANYFKIGHNALEFIFDFGQLYAESQRAQFHTRIITHPGYAKALLGLLQEAIAQYEQTFGAIRGG